MRLCPSFTPNLPNSFFCPLHLPLWAVHAVLSVVSLVSASWANRINQPLEMFAFHRKCGQLHSIGQTASSTHRGAHIRSPMNVFGRMKQNVILFKPRKLVLYTWMLFFCHFTLKRTLSWPKSRETRADSVFIWWYFTSWWLRGWCLAILWLQL